MGEEPWEELERCSQDRAVGSLALGGQRKSLQWLRGGDLARVGVARSRGQKKAAPGSGEDSLPLTPATFAAHGA